MKHHITLFDWGRSNRMGLAPIVDDGTWEFAYWWLNGRILGHYVSIELPRWIR